MTDERLGWLLTALCLALAGLRVAGAAPSAAPGEVLVKWAPDPAGKAIPGAAWSGPIASAALADLEAQFGPARREPLVPAPVPARPAAGDVHLQRQHLSRWENLRFAEPADPLELTSRAAGLPGVVAAQPNYLRTPCYSSDDPMLADQWALSSIGWLDAPPPNARGIVVGVVDSGADIHHPDLRDQIWINAAEWGGEPRRDDDGNGYIDDMIGWDFVDAPGLAGSGDYLTRDADPSDESGHGTHVAGIIAAGVGNGEGIAGLAPAVRLMVLRAGFNAAGGGYLADDDVAAAIVYGVENGAHVLNLSFGDPHPAPVLQDALAYAHAAGVTVVAAAGNTGEEGVLYPARFSEVIAVAATTASGRVASFSSWGHEVDVAAPGLQIRSLSLGGGYADLSGTSMAAAHVSGLSALILARQPGLRPVQVRGGLAAVARDLGSRGWDAFAGHGLATASALDGPPNGARFARPASGQSLTGGDEVVLERAGPDSEGHWSVAWARAGEGVWQRLAEAVARPGTDLGFVLPDLGPGEYVLRAAYADSISASIDRSWSFVPFVVPGQAPRVDSLTWSRVLQGRWWAELIEWRTDRPAGGLVAVADDLVLPVPGGRTDHWMVLPRDLDAGTYEIAIDVESRGLHQAAVAVEVGARGLEALPALPIATLPEGYLLPAMPDLDGDGRPEIAAMSASATGYGAVDFYEADDTGHWSRSHRSALTFIPWAAGDLDGDGLSEIMAVDAERVRLLETDAPGGYPATAVWEQGEVWGGVVGDVDGDGLMEMHLPSSRADLVRVFENRGDNRHDPMAILANPTAGDNDAGDRFVLADLDGDGRHEVLFGDGDGDVAIYGAVGDDALRWEWSGPGPGGDSRLVGGGADLDGDGRTEVAIGGFSEDVDDPSHSMWTIAIYEVGAGTGLEQEWEIRVLGGRSTRNGIAMGDLDGDGMPELVVGLSPNLYVLRAAAPDQYDPVWWSAADSPRRAAVGDADGDGTMDVAYSAVGEISIARFPLSRGRLPAPVGLQAWARGRTSIELDWAAVTGAARYVVRRHAEDADTQVDTVEGTGWLDAGVSAAIGYTYTAAAITDAGELGLWSTEARATPESPPRLVGAERLAETVAAAHFDSAMALEAEEPHRYRLEPSGTVARSAVLDRGGRRVVIGFSSWPEGPSPALATAGLRSLRGTPVAPGDGRTAVIDARDPAVTRLSHAEPLSPTEILLKFTRPVTATAMQVRAVRVEGGAIEVVSLRALAGGEIVAEISPLTPLVAPAGTYGVRVSGLVDETGRRVEGYAALADPIDRLGRVVAYPNPYDPAAGELRIAPLPAGARVAITTAAGQAVWSAEAGDDGAVTWRGKNRAGRVVGTGLYLYWVSSFDTQRSGRIAVVSGSSGP